jgi:hypothetical protein
MYSSDIERSSRDNGRGRGGKTREPKSIFTCMMYMCNNLCCTYGRACLSVGRAPALAGVVAHVGRRAEVEIVAVIAGLPRLYDGAKTVYGAYGWIALSVGAHVGVIAVLARVQTTGRADTRRARVAKAALVPIVAGGPIRRDSAVNGLQCYPHGDTDRSISNV